MGMQKVDYVKMVKDIWDVEITQKQWENIVNKHQNIIKEYNTQKSIFGFNMFNGRHKPTKKLIGYE